MSIRIEIRTSGFDRLSTRLEGMAARLESSPRRVVEKSSDVMVDALRAVAPKRTGQLAANVYARVEGARATFWDRKFYTPFVLRGTRPHLIWAGFYSGASSKRALWWPGARHPTPYVQHPGTRPNPFNRVAFAAALPGIRAVIALVGREIVGL